jgi:type II secretory pathway component PulK
MQRQSPITRPDTASSRRGTVLVIVLVVVALLSLGAYTFSQVMMVESEATGMYARQVQTRAMADSGVELVLALLGDSLDPADIGLYHDPDRFQGVEVLASDNAAFSGRFSVVAPIEADPEFRRIRFGLIDESSRINLNAILTLDLDTTDFDLATIAGAGDDDPDLSLELAQREVLMGLPGMTEEIADCILDWLDDDDDERELGAELDYYEGIGVGYMPRNGPIDSLDELLRVKGVDSWLLYGEDANRNGLLDANEDDGEARPPFDDADGELALGWTALLTTNSREVNLRADGEEKLNVNQDLLTELYDAIEEEFDEDTAKFVVAYRMYGSTDDPETGDWPVPEPMDEVTRGELNLARGYRREIRSVYELIGITVTADEEGEEGDQMYTYESPWSGEPGSMASYLPELLNVLSVSDDPYIEGRINVNQARRDVLWGVPGLSEETVEAILVARAVDSETGDSTTDLQEQRATSGWLVIEGLVELETMRELDPFLTSRGAVFRMQIVGHYDAGGPFTRIEAVIDASGELPKVTFVRDLTELGKGYSYQLLIPD